MLTVTAGEGVSLFELAPFNNVQTGPVPTVGYMGNRARSVGCWLLNGSLTSN